MQNKTNSTVASRLQELAAGMTETKDYKDSSFVDVAVNRHGRPEILLPEKMSTRAGSNWLARAAESEERETQFQYTFSNHHPLDALYVLVRVINRIFGFSELRGQPSWFGENPPRKIGVQTGETETSFLPFDRLYVPTLEGGYLEPSIDMSGLLRVEAYCKQRIEPAIRAVFDLTIDTLKRESIYRGKALIYGDKHKDLSGVADPQFWVPGTTMSDVILSRQTEAEVTANILHRITAVSALEALGVPFRSTHLLTGTYGTGKTLTAAVCATLARCEGITFVYVRDTTELVEALEFAKRYQPAVVFAEDVDRIVSGERTAKTDGIWNTVDGLQKDSDIMLVLTSNEPESIQPGFIRRLNSVIWFERPDAATAVRFIEHYAGDMLADGIDLTPISETLTGLIPAQLSEVARKAKLFAHVDARDKLEPSDIAHAAAQVKATIDLMEAASQVETETPVEAFAGWLAGTISSEMRSQRDRISADMTDLKYSVKEYASDGARRGVSRMKDSVGSAAYDGAEQGVADNV